MAEIPKPAAMAPRAFEKHAKHSSEGLEGSGDLEGLRGSGNFAVLRIWRGWLLGFNVSGSRVSKRGAFKG